MLKLISRPRAAIWLISGLLILAYGLMPWILHQIRPNGYERELIGITLVGVVSMAAGWQVRQTHRIYLLSVDRGFLVAAIWIPFILFSMLALVSAERIPVLVALKGATPAEIAYYRELFLKARTGWQSSFVYINAMLTGALVPYSLAVLFYYKLKFRWVLFAYFLLYTLSFMEKAFFIRAVFPLIVLVLQGKIRLPVKPIWVLLGSFMILVGVSSLSGLGGLAPEATGTGDFLTGRYLPNGTLELILWRTVAIPVLTALDSLRVFHQDFLNAFFHGGTSSFLSPLLGVPHVEFERAVFFAEWGQNATGTGSANAVYLIEAFINWGYPGVVALSFFGGAFLRSFAESKDAAFQAMWLLFAVLLFSGGMIGILLSNGWLLLFLMVFLIHFHDSRSIVAEPVARA